MSAHLEDKLVQRVTLHTTDYYCLLLTTAYYCSLAHLEDELVQCIILHQLL